MFSGVKAAGLRVGGLVLVARQLLEDIDTGHLATFQVGLSPISKELLSAK